MDYENWNYIFEILFFRISIFIKFQESFEYLT